MYSFYKNENELKEVCELLGINRDLTSVNK